MKVLSIGTDRKLFETGSQVLERSLLIAKNVEELHIVVFTRVKHNLDFLQIGNLYIYPTNSISRFLYIYDAIKICRAIIKEKGLSKINTVVCAQDPFETGYVGAKLKTEYSLPLQIQIHTDIYSPFFAKNLLNIIRVRMSYFILPKADSIRAVSQRVLNSVKARFKKITPIQDVLPVFVDIESIMSNTEERDLKKEFPEFNFIILMASRMEREKGVVYALRMLKEVLKKYNRVGLIIAGSGSEINNLKNTAYDLEVNNNVRFIGWHNELIPFYKSANMFLLTSIYEGYGMTLIEAGASGCPVVTFNVGIASEIYKDGESAYICDVSNVDCLVERTIKLIEDPRKREIFKVRARENVLVMHESREEYGVKYVALLDKIKYD